jgi:hypothetical protein
MSYFEVLMRFFPTVRTEVDFVRETAWSLGPLGFTAQNTIAIVDVCRDEISQSIVRTIREQWGEAFNLCSLAGMFFAGRTALSAAMHHAPRLDGRERYAFFSLPHIAVDGEGRLGVCARPGVGESNACGALNAFLEELNQGRLNISVDENDLEQSLLKMRLIKEIPYGQVPDLLTLTRTVQRVALCDLEAALRPLVDLGHCDYAVLSGIQIHGPDGNHVAPTAGYALVRGARHDIVAA